MSREIVLKVSNVSKSYKNCPVLQGIDLTVHKGEIYGFIGKNGAGKTTLIRLLSGLAMPDQGEFELFGVSSRSREIVRARKRLCAMVESPAIYGELSAEENMKAQCIILKKPFSCIQQHLAFVGLGNTGSKKARDFSLGMRQRLAIAIALIGEPELMLLDEPINGLDPTGIKSIRELLLKLNQEKQITIFISSHILSELGMLANVFGFIDGGKLLKEVTAEQIEAATSEHCRIESDDPPKALERLRSLGYQAEMSDGAIRVATDVDLMRVCADFAANGIRLQKHIHAAMDLESYYMHLLGGEV